MANTKQPAIVSLPSDLRDEITVALLKHGKVKVVGLGIFEMREIPSRPGRNPKTGEIMQIKAYWKIKFRPTKQLKESVC
jgi:nucleoid DNA-binding protein